MLLVVIVENRPPLFAYLYGPVTIMLLGNAIVVILIVFALCKITRYDDEAPTIVLPNLTGYANLFPRKTEIKLISMFCSFAASASQWDYSC